MYVEYIQLCMNRYLIIEWEWRSSGMGGSEIGSKVWNWSIGSLEVASYAGVHMGWHLKVRGSLQNLAFKLRAAAS